MDLISSVSLWIIAAACFAGALLPKAWFDDNLMQRTGMAGMAIALTPRVLASLDLNAQWIPPENEALIHGGLALYVLGSALKVWKHRPRKPPSPPKYHRADWAG